MASGMNQGADCISEAVQQPNSVWPVAETLAWRLVEKVLASNPESTSDSRDAVGQRVLVSSLHRAQAALRLAELGHDVTLFDFEHYRWRLYQALLPTMPNLNLLCAADPPAEPRCDLAILSLRRDWGAELTRDLLQMFAGCIAAHGSWIVVVDHPDDQWLGDHLREFSKQVKRFTSNASDSDGKSLSEKGSKSSAYGSTAYLLSGSDLKVRHRDFRCQFAFRDQGRLLQVVSRPGVFSHRKLDLGARRLMEAMQITSGQRVLDIGCGSGVVAFAAATRGEGVTVAAIDSNARAIECVQQGIALNNLAGCITPFLSSDGTVPDQVSGSFDVALANPPYYANFQIAELFLAAAKAALRPGGMVWVVGKQPDWYSSNVPRWFDRVEMQQVGGGYCIASGRRPT
jgi:16S rRNA (guanine1207-N2)-methyltransferase